VPSTSRLSEALPLWYSNGHDDTQRSNTPVVAKLRKKDQLAVRRGRRTFFPTYVHSTAKGVYHLGLIGCIFELGKGSYWPMFVFTHWVSVPNSCKPTPVLGLRAIAGSELLFLVHRHASYET
jgi:hypothetical protein